MQFLLAPAHTNLSFHTRTLSPRIHTLTDCDFLPTEWQLLLSPAPRKLRFHDSLHSRSFSFHLHLQDCDSLHLYPSCISWGPGCYTTSRDFFQFHSSSSRFGAHYRL